MGFESLNKKIKTRNLMHFEKKKREFRTNINIIFEIFGFKHF